eukprot:scaffold118740_cov30-Tisochrysis_lutea.AAC.2
MRATPPSLRISAGTRSSAITAQAPRGEWEGGRVAVRWAKQPMSMPVKGQRTDCLNLIIALVALLYLFAAVIVRVPSRTPTFSLSLIPHRQRSVQLGSCSHPYLRLPTTTVRA